MIKNKKETFPNEISVTQDKTKTGTGGGQEEDIKMKLNPKIILGSLVILSLLVIITAFYIFRQSRILSSISVISEENKFKVLFDIRPKDKADFAKVLERLNIPENVVRETSFKLDATSSAMFTFFSPIKSNLKFSPKTVRFEGTLFREPFQDKNQVENIKIPKSTNLAVFAPNVNGFVSKSYFLPQPFSEWLEKNFSTANGQYLVIFGENADFAVFSKQNEIDFESLKNIKTGESLESAYKEETFKNVTFHLLKLPEDKEGNQQTVTLFRLGDYVVFSSSREAAQKLLDPQDSQGEWLFFPDLKTGQNAPFILLYHNNNEAPIGQKFTKLFLLGQTKEVEKVIEKISKFSIILKADKFSGLINIK